MRTVQKSTRQIHAICTHGKNTKRNSGIAAIVPRVKRSLEVFLFKAGGMLASGNRAGVQIGNLKYKTLDGKPVDQPEDSSDDESDKNFVLFGGSLGIEYSNETWLLQVNPKPCSEGQGSQPCCAVS